MKILVLSNLYPPDFIGGYEICCEQVVNGLLSRGHDVQVLTANPRTPCPELAHVQRRWELTNIYDSYCPEHSWQITRDEWEGRANFCNAHNAYVLLELLREFEPDVVYLWNLVGIGGLGLVGALTYLQYPWVWYLGDCIPRILCSRKNRAVPGLVDGFNRHVRGYFMPVSDRVVEEIEECGIRLQGTIEPMPNWICGQEPPRRETFYSGGTLNIVSAGQMGRHKGIDRVIDAAGQLLNWGFDNFQIDLFGKISDDDFPTMIEAQGLTDHVHLRGSCPQAELIRRYQQHQYDVFAFPTWEREPFGCAPLEAAAFGCVPIMTESCGIGEWFVDGLHCLKVPRRSEEFAVALRQILEGDIDLAPIATRTSAMIWRDFHLETLLPGIEQALLSAVRETPTPPYSQRISAEAYRLALLGDKLGYAVVQEAA